MVSHLRRRLRLRLRRSMGWSPARVGWAYRLLDVLRRTSPVPRPPPPPPPLPPEAPAGPARPELDALPPTEPPAAPVPAEPLEPPVVIPPAPAVPPPAVTDALANEGPTHMVPPAVPGLPFVLSPVWGVLPTPSAPTTTVNVSGGQRRPGRQLRWRLIQQLPPPPRTVLAAPFRPESAPPPWPLLAIRTDFAHDGLVPVKVPAELYGSTRTRSVALPALGTGPNPISSGDSRGSQLILASVNHQG